MDINTKKAWLSRWRDAAPYREKLAQKIDDWERRLQGYDNALARLRPGLSRDWKLRQRSNLRKWLKRWQEELGVNAVVREEIQFAIDQVKPEKYRELLREVYLHGVTLTDYGESIGISRAAVYARHKRAVELVEVLE